MKAVLRHPCTGSMLLIAAGVLMASAEVGSALPATMPAMPEHIKPYIPPAIQRVYEQLVPQELVEWYTFMVGSAHLWKSPELMALVVETRWPSVHRFYPAAMEVWAERKALLSKSDGAHGYFKKLTAFATDLTSAINSLIESHIDVAEIPVAAVQFICEWTLHRHDDYTRLSEEHQQHVQSAFEEGFRLGQFRPFRDAMEPLWELFCEIDPVWLRKYMGFSFAVVKLLKLVDADESGVWKGIGEREEL